jgi:hypothetical protein
VVLVGVSEGINASQMARFGSPYYAPLMFVGLLLIGIGLVWSASRSVGYSDLSSHSRGDG